ncbi:MAG: hypothetical protein M3320_05750, partial [Actinomycetota bacterium]|nr:hypothetical protein [Actinomycetota bacterium]
RWIRNTSLWRRRKRIFGQFVRCRFDFAALTFDCVATFFSPGHPGGRVYALVFACVLLGGPIYILAAGDNAFGDPLIFGATLVGSTVILEAPGRALRLRQPRTATNGADAIRDFDLFLLVTFMLVAAAAPVLLLDIDDPSRAFTGVLWGVALAGAQDLLRSLVALAVALMDGHPLYDTNG